VEKSSCEITVQSENNVALSSLATLCAKLLENETKGFLPSSAFDLVSRWFKRFLRLTKHRSSAKTLSRTHNFYPRHGRAPETTSPAPEQRTTQIAKRKLFFGHSDRTTSAQTKTQAREDCADVKGWLRCRSLRTRRRCRCRCRCCRGRIRFSREVGSRTRGEGCSASTGSGSCVASPARRKTPLLWFGARCFGLELWNFEIKLQYKTSNRFQKSAQLEEWLLPVKLDTE